MVAVERSEHFHEVRVSDKDEILLHRIYREVNRCHYSGKISIPVRWEIPSASEAPEPPRKLSTLSNDEMKHLLRAVKAYELQDFECAKYLILPFTNIGVTDADQLYIRILMAANDPKWADAARKINNVSADTLFVPAASTEVLERVEIIFVHPALSKSSGYNAPRYVLRYVLFHEFLHKFLNTCADDPHPKLFRTMEKAVPERAKAITWLQAHQFSTVENHQP